MALGVLVGMWVSVRNSERLGIDGEKAWNLGILVVLCGIVGAKVLYVINDWSEYAAHPSEIFSISTLQAGGVFSGGHADLLYTLQKSGLCSRSVSAYTTPCLLN